MLRPIVNHWLDKIRQEWVFSRPY